MNDEQLLKRIDQSFLATNSRMNELIEITLELRAQVSYLKEYTKVLGTKYEELDHSIKRMV